MAQANVVEILVKIRDEASTAVTNIANEFAGLGGSITRLASAAGPIGIIAGVLAVTSVATIGFADKLSKAEEQLNIMSKRTGVSTQNLQVLQEGLVEAGGGADDAVQAFTFLNRAIGRNDPLLKQLGITSRDVFTAFRQLSAAFAASDDVAKKNAISFRLLGRGSAELVGIMEDLNSNFDDMKQKATAAGIVLDDKVKAKAEALDARMDKLARDWRGAVTQMQAALTPAAIGIVDSFNAVTSSVEGLWQKYQGMTNALAVQLTVALHAPTQADVDAAAKKTVEQTQANFNASGMGQALAKLVSQEQSKFMPQALSKVNFHDALGGVNPDAQSNDRVKKLEELEKILNIDAAAADKLLDRLEAIENRAKRAKIEQTLFEDQQPHTVAEAVRREQQFSNIDTRSDEIKQRPSAPFVPKLDVSQLVDAPKLKDYADNSFEGVVASWREAVTKIMSTSQILDDTLGAAFDGLTSGFNTIFQQLHSHSLTFKSGITAIFQSLETNIEQIIGRLISSAIWNEFLNILSAISGFGFATAAIGAASGSMGGTGGGNLPSVLPPSTSPPPPMSGARQVINNYTIQALDARDAILNLRSPNGALRVSNERMAASSGF